MASERVVYVMISATVKMILMEMKVMNNEHPLHPYTVYLSRRKELIFTTYVSAFSSTAAEKGAVNHYQQLFKKRITFDQVKAVPLMPINLNQYWGKINLGANPKGLQLNQAENL